MEKLPQTVLLRFRGDPDDFDVTAEVEYEDDVPEQIKVGRVCQGGDDGWAITYADGDADSAVGPLAAVGIALDNALDEDDDGEDDGDDGDEDDEDDEDDDDDEDDEDDDEDDDDGRDWDLVAWNTFALEIVGHGCLVRYENEDPATMTFVPGVTVADLKRDPGEST